MNPRSTVTTAVVGLLALGPLLSCGRQAPAEAPVETPVAQETAAPWDVVGAAWRWHIEAAKRKDLEGVLEIYADDVFYSVPGQPDVRGIAAVREMEAHTLATAEVVEAEHRSLSLHAFGDVAYEIGTVVGPVRVGAEQPRLVRWHFMALWQRDANGIWRIRHVVGQTSPDDVPE